LKLLRGPSVRWLIRYINGLGPLAKETQYLIIVVIVDVVVIVVVVDTFQF